MKSRALAEPVLVGRDEELGELQRTLNSVLMGRGTAFFVSGEAGSGKTRLINEFLERVEEREITILSGCCLSNAPLPYFPFIEAFSSGLPSREYARTVFGQQLSINPWQLSEYPTESREKNKVITPQVWKDQAFSAMTKELLFRSSVKPLILVLEDMHWADSASLALLHYLSRGVIFERVLILVTFRTEELGSNAEGNPHPLVETIQLMGREGLFKEIKLGNLNHDAVKRIAESMLGSNVDGTIVEKLSEESHGNPLFVVEFLRMLSESGSLIREQGQWQLAVDELDIPSKVKEIILRRISALKPDQRRILNVASVIGDTFNPDLIGAVLSRDKIEILEVLNEILHSTSLVSVEETLYSFDHAKTREVLYDGLSLPLKRGYHQRIAEKIENANQNTKRASFSDLAHHYAQAGNKEKTVKYSLAAGQDALSRFSNSEAIKYFSNIMQITANHHEYSSERNVALEGLGDAYYANCRFEEAAKTFEKLAISGADVVRLRAYRKEMEAFWSIEYDSSRLMQLVKKAEKYATSDLLERARVLWNKGRASVRLRDLKLALKYHEEALKIFEEEYSLPDIAQLLAGTGITRIMIGLNPERGLGELQRSIALYQELNDVRGEIVATMLRSNGFQFCGLYKEFAGTYDKIIKIAEEIGDFEDLTEISIWMSYRFEVLGKIYEAITQSLKALGYSRKTDSTRLHGELFAGLTRQYAKIGDLKQADHYFGMLSKMPHDALSFPRNAFPIALAEAILFAAKGEWNESNQRFQRIVETPNPFWGHIGMEYLCRINHAWALDLQGRTKEAEIHRREIQKIEAKAEERFAHSDLQSELMILRRFVVGKEVEMRLDIVNVGNVNSHIIRVKGLIPHDVFKVRSLPSCCSLQNSNLEFGTTMIGSFQVKTIKLNVQAMKACVLSLSPQVVYIDDSNNTITCRSKAISITIMPKPSDSKGENITELVPTKIEFKSETAQKAFDFLIKAFVEDYYRLRLPRERSGWRTLMNIVKYAHVSQYSMYGSSGSHGRGASELERLGVVEARFFFGERGRGGKVQKLRVACEKENIRRYIDQRI